MKRSKVTTQSLEIFIRQVFATDCASRDLQDSISVFDRKFIADSFSCRLEKGTHRAINRFRNFISKSEK